MMLGESIWTLVCSLIKVSIVLQFTTKYFNKDFVDQNVKKAPNQYVSCCIVA